MNLENKAALVTGASRGLGKAIALELAKHGANVAVNYVALEERNEIEAIKVSEECIRFGTKSIAVEANISKFSSCEKMIENVLGTFGKIDILINNAGIVKDRTLQKMTSDEWESVLDVNLTGTFNTTKTALSSMMEQGWGRIINVSSIIGITGGFGQSNYAASKAGIIGLSKSLAREVASKGITVNAIAPGYIATEMVAGMPENVLEEYKQQIPMKRLGLPEEVAGLTAFLCSDIAGYITGQVFGINGGLLM